MCQLRAIKLQIKIYNCKFIQDGSLTLSIHYVNESLKWSFLGVLSC